MSERHNAPAAPPGQEKALPRARTRTTTTGTGTGTGTATAWFTTRSSGHAKACAVALALLVLALTAAGQAVVFALSGSVALLADLIHNIGDAAAAFPLGIAFALRSARAEHWAGLAVVVAIFVSACVAGYEAVDRLIHPQEIERLGALAAAGVLGFVGNWTRT